MKVISEIENSEFLTSDICKGKDGEEINSQCYWFYISMTTQTPPIMLRNENDSITNINMSMFSI
jgi:hypothetical protein